jgi:hypothetical protein
MTKSFSTSSINSLINLSSFKDKIYATGGNEVIDINNFRYHVFTSVGLNSFQVLSGKQSVEVMMCGGGGAGGYRIGGGGGGGELKLFTATTLNQGVYQVIVGYAGLRSTISNGLKNNGGSSRLIKDSTVILSALGGGAGGTQANGDGNTGGSGGGGNEWSLSGTGGKPGIAVGSNTNAGGDARTSPWAGGGGGGVTASGSSAVPLGGNGGGGGSGILLTNVDSNFTSGNFSTFSGMTVICSGGGGGSYVGGTTGGAGGTGAGSGGTPSVVATSATSFGSGGGGGGGDQGGALGSSGYQGLVVIKYSL